MSTSKGLRHNEGKLRYDLVPPEWLEVLAHVMTKGAEKYEPRNWEKGMEWSKCYASLMRHVQAWYAGEDTDQESGLPHMAHAAWNALALVTYAADHPEYDDRPLSHDPVELFKDVIKEQKGLADRLREKHIWSDPLKPTATGLSVQEEYGRLPSNVISQDEPNVSPRSCDDRYSHGRHTWGPGDRYFCRGFAFDRT